MRDFHMTMDTALETPLDQAFALSAWNTEANPWSKVRAVTDRYIAQEAHQL
jgi:hypothetical protein